MINRKICIIITSRGNYAKMKTTMSLINETEGLELQLILGGGIILPKYGKMDSHIKNQGFTVNRVVHFLLEGENLVTMAKSTGLAITELSTIFENFKPDVAIVIADRFESLSVAIAASYMNIPLAHIEGGEVSGSIDESIRHAITKLSHLHFPATEDAEKRLIRMGEDPDTIINVGCSSIDIINQLDLNNIEILKELMKKGLGEPIDVSKPYLLVLQHPVTTEYEQNLLNINETIDAIDDLKIGTIWIWPNMDAGSDGISGGIRIYREKNKPKHVHFFKSLPIELFAPLLKNASCVIGNSSSGIRESNYLGVPSVNIGSRQGGRERGHNVIDVDYDSKQIKVAIERQLKHGRYDPEFIFGKGDSAEKIIDTLKTFKFKIQKRIMY